MSDYILFFVRGWTWVKPRSKLTPITVAALKALDGDWSTKIKAFAFYDLVVETAIVDIMGNEPVGSITRDHPGPSRSWQACLDDLEAADNGAQDWGLSGPRPPGYDEQLATIVREEVRQRTKSPSPKERKAAERLRGVARAAQATADQKRGSSIRDQNWTRRRAGMIASMDREAAQWERVASAAEALAAAWESMSVPEILRQVRSKVLVHQFVVYEEWSFGGGYNSAEDSRLFRATISTAEEYAAARRELARLGEWDAAASAEAKADRLRELEDKARSLIGVTPGFYPTPESIARTMVVHANLEPGMRVLEPSAGSGAILDVLTAMCPEAEVFCCEWAHTLQELLQVKGYDLLPGGAGGDFFQLHPGEFEWDVVIQNPPFEKHADIRHIKHAVAVVRPGGRVISLVSPSSYPGIGNSKVVTNFLAWLEELDWQAYQLPDDAFEGVCGVRGVQMLVIDKEDEP